MTPSDIAIYGTLCGLASMSRSAIKARLLDNSVFSVYIEQEPYVRELLEAYVGSNFKTTLELLSRYSVSFWFVSFMGGKLRRKVKTRHYIDIHISSHVYDLTNKIKNSAVVLYFQPFSSIKVRFLFLFLFSFLFKFG